MNRTFLRSLVQVRDAAMIDRSEFLGIVLTTLEIVDPEAWVQVQPLLDRFDSHVATAGKVGLSRKETAVVLQEAGGSALMCLLSFCVVGLAISYRYEASGRASLLRTQHFIIMTSLILLSIPSFVSCKAGERVLRAPAAVSLPRRSPTLF